MLRETCIFHIYTMLWCCYELMVVLEMNTTWILLLLITYSLLNTLYVNIHYKVNAFLKGLNILLIMFSVYGIALILKGDHVMRETGDFVPNHAYLGMIYSSILPIYTYYLYAKKGFINNKMICFYTVIFFLVSIVCFKLNYKNFLLMDFLRDEFTNNYGKDFVYILPFLFFFRDKKKIQYVLFVALLIFILMSMKRGAILAGGVVSIYFIYNSFKTYSVKEKRFALILITISLFVICYYIFNTLFHSDYFQIRLEATLNGDSSGRDTIYKDLYRLFFNTVSEFTILFGYGANATIKYLGIEAHNDWLEILINNGLLGVFLYLIYWLFYYQTWKQMKKITSTYIYYTFGAYFLIMFLFSLYSMSYASIAISAKLGIGYCLAEFEKERKILNY